MKKILILGIITVGLMGSFIVTKAYSYVGYKWNPASAGYELNIAGWQSFPIHNARNSWNGAGSSFSFNYLGDTAYPFQRNGHNTITRANQGNTGRLATTQPWCNTGNGNCLPGYGVVEVDVLFNDHYPWGAYGEPNMFDLESVMAHEFGHWLVLDHSSSLCGWPGEATMCDGMSLGETRKRTLQGDDVSGIRYVYP